jgi:hypothetical protein
LTTESLKYFQNRIPENLVGLLRFGFWGASEELVKIGKKYNKFGGLTSYAQA